MRKTKGGVMPFGLPEIMGITQGVGNPLMQHFTNVANRKFAREQYKTQRQDALADWNMQNAYNSPEQQMTRFKQAGLNPHLIYGQGNVAQPVRSSSAQGSQATAPRADLGAMYSFALRDNQADLTAANARFLKARERQVAAQTVKTLADVDLTKQNVSRGAIKLAIEQNLKDSVIARYNWETDLVKEKYNEQYWKSFYAEQLQKMNVEKAIESTKNSQKFRELSDARKLEIEQRIENMKKDGTIKDFEIELNKAGTMRKDSLPERLIMMIMQAIFGDLR